MFNKFQWTMFLFIVTFSTTTQAGLFRDCTSKWIDQFSCCDDICCNNDCVLTDDDCTGCLDLDGCCCCEDPFFVPSMIGDGLGGVPLLASGAGLLLHTPRPFTKISDNNSPLTRDRIYLTYKQFDDVTVLETVAGVANQPREIFEYRLGAEKRLFDGLISVELIVPVYDTVSNTVTLPVQRSGEMGNISFGFKMMIFETDNTAISAGLRVEAPTESDIRIGGTVIKNDVWSITPYLGGLWTRNDFFVQGFMSTRLRTKGQDWMVGANQFAEDIDQNLFMLDLGIGRRYRVNRPFIREIVPTLEMHYMTTLEQDAHGINTLAHQVYGRHMSNFNVTAGATAWLSDRVTLAAGFTLPMLEHRTNFPGFTTPTDRQYDWELGLHATLYGR